MLPVPLASECAVFCRLPFKAAQTLEPTNKNSFSLITTALIKMKADMADAPYIFEKGKPTTWYFSLSFAQMAEFLPIVHQYLAASRMPPADREEALQASLLAICVDLHTLFKCYKYK